MTAEAGPQSAHQRWIRHVEQQETLELPQRPPRKRRRIVPWAAKATLVVGLGAIIAAPLVQSTRGAEKFADPPGVTDGPSSSSPPSPSLSPSGEPIPPQPSYPEPPVIPTPVYVASVCETQAGTEEGQLPDGTPVLPGTMDRPSIFVISPDRASEQSFSVRPAIDSDTDWYTISQADNVGIVGIATGDLEVDTTGGRAVWAKTCEPTSLAAVEEVRSRTGDLCRRREFGFTEVVVYHVGPDGRPVEMHRTNC